MVLALPLLLVAPQIAIGRREIWLPKVLLRRTIKRPPLIKLLKRVLPRLERVEKVVRPRLRFLTGRVGACMVGVACTIIALVLVLPIPFANLVPALALGAFSIGLTRKDGLFVLAGYGLIAVAWRRDRPWGSRLALGLSHLQQLFEQSGRHADSRRAGRRPAPPFASDWSSLVSRNAPFGLSLDELTSRALTLGANAAAPDGHGDLFIA
jgi:hypothetical protein